MSPLAWIIGFTLTGGALSALAASIFLAIPERGRARLLPHLISFATGTLLSAALLALLPQALTIAGTEGAQSIGLTLLCGILAFFTLEKLVLWRHCHHDHWETHTPSEHHHDAASGTMILVGDTMHNLVDGVLIGAAFLTDINLGILAGAAVIAHEIPQEIGDLAVLLHSGMSRGRALLLNLLVSLTSVFGGLFSYFWLEDAERLLPYVLAVAASSFIYIAVADLIPGLHRRVDIRASIHQLLAIGAGVSVIFVIHSNFH